MSEPDPRDGTTTLQDALLPTDLPVLPRLDVAARYVLAAEPTAAGGDWFDAVALSDGRVALVVGDVVGHGVSASAVMGQLRAVLESQLVLGRGLEECLHGVDAFARRLPEAHSATVCVVVIDTTTGHMEFCTAGHPPPLVVSRDGETSYLLQTGSGPLASGTGFHVSSARLELGELLVLYTDGIVERPGHTFPISTVELAQTVAFVADDGAFPDGPQRPVERVCQLVLEQLALRAAFADDVILLAAQRRPAHSGLRLDLPSSPEQVSAVRVAFDEWLDGLEVRPLDHMVVQHAVSELVANAIQHGSRHASGPATFQVRAEIGDEGQLRCTVADRGRWQPPTRGEGRGLAMVRGLVDDLDVAPGAHGTAATFRHRLSRSAAILTSAAGLSQPVSAAEPFRIAVDGDQVRVHGTVDAMDADELRTALLAASHGGVGRVAVDLTGVNHLGSAGVQVLIEATAQTAGATLRAPNGSVAQHVLDLARLPYQDPYDETS